MNAALDDVLEAVLARSEEERLELLEAIVQSFADPASLPLDESLRTTVRRRSAELRSGHVRGIPWSDVKRKGQEQGPARG